MARRSWPLLNVPVYRPTFGQDYVNFRATKLWNALQNVAKKKKWDSEMT